MDAKATFYGGKAMVLIPLAVFLGVALDLFLAHQAFDLLALAVGGLGGLFAGALLSRNQTAYWDAVVRGAASQLTGTVIVILLAAGVFSAMMKSGGIADGFVWIGLQTGISGGVFTAFVLLASAVVATATGSSIGTILTAVPIFFPAGVALGCEPALLAGAILSGAIFGDNLAPVSDVTVISASTQTYARREGVADIGGVVAARLPYALAALALSLPVYAMFGGAGLPAASAGAAGMAGPAGPVGDPRGLIMLLPVAVLIAIAVRTRNVLSAAMGGIITGIAAGLLAGRFDPATVFHVENGVASGFLYTGLSGVSGVVLLCVTLFGITGAVHASGALDALGERLGRSGAGATGGVPDPSGARTECLLACGALLTSAAFASVTSAALILFGPMGDEIGKARGIHPYRRSHIMSGMANSLPVLLPFSAFVLIVLGTTGGLPGGESVTPFSLMYGAVYPLALFAVFAVSIATGLGRRFEGADGRPARDDPRRDESGRGEVRGAARAAAAAAAGEERS